MVAILLVFANHLWGWPRGGFVGVDVFFVISGFLMTGSLLRMAERDGKLSVKKFSWKCARRIVPAAAVVLVLTFVAAVVFFQPHRARSVGIDALFASVFMANWRFAVQTTDHASAGDAVSPIQHFWSLAVGGQFYFVWFALIFVIGLAALSRSWGNDDRLTLAGRLMAVTITVSFGWAVYQSMTEPGWAYFETFSRVWELGIGALMATAVRSLAAIPDQFRSILSWSGLGLIAVSALLISEGAVGFPAPWALLPVAGSALVIGAGVGGTPVNHRFLGNWASVYVGDIAYSLYLVHWPVIVILGALMVPHGVAFTIAVVGLAFGLAIASFHFVENPMRYGSLAELRRKVRKIRKGRFEPARSTGYAVLAVTILITVGLIGYAGRLFPEAKAPPGANHAAGHKPTPGADQQLATPTSPHFGPRTTALQRQISEALKATSWPPLDPTIDDVLAGKVNGPADIASCGSLIAPAAGDCVWGPASPTRRVVVVGDSIALKYAAPLRESVVKSNGQINVLATAGCQFSDDWIKSPSKEVTDACPARKQHTIDVINQTKPDLVIIADSYDPKYRVGSDQALTSEEWADGMRRIVDKFKANVGKIVWLAAPPADKILSECYSSRSSPPGDCVGVVTPGWAATAESEQSVARSEGGIWIDSRPLFCSDEGFCPAFVGLTPTKFDGLHMTAAYAEKIQPVIAELFDQAGAPL